MHDEAIKDIANALHQLREACDTHQIPPPDILSWSDWKEGREARMVLNSVKSGSDLMSFRVGPSHGPDDEIVGFVLKYSTE